MAQDILLVEDTLTQAMLFQHLLEKNGQQVKLARSGAKALELLEKLEHLKELPALILTDINMPEMDGYQLCAKIKENPAYSHIHVVLFASATKTSEIALILNSGADDIVFKKWNEEKLVKKLKTIVQQVSQGSIPDQNRTERFSLNTQIGGQDLDVSFTPGQALAIMSSLYEFLCPD